VYRFVGEVFEPTYFESVSVKSNNARDKYVLKGPSGCIDTSYPANVLGNPYRFRNLFFGGTCFNCLPSQ